MTFPTTRPKKLPSPILFLLLASVAALSTACGGADDTTTATAERPPVRARTARVEPTAVADPSEHTGTVVAIRRVEPGTKLLGRVDAVLVEEGEPVRAGQVLARLEKRDLDAAVAQAEAAVKMAEARLENARAQHARMESLHRRGSVTDKNLEDAVAGLRVAEAGVEQARADVHAARVMRSYAEVRSPFDGWVTAKHLEVGDMARPGAPLFVVEDLSRVKLEVDVPEAAVGDLAAGDAAQATVAGGAYRAQIHRVVPAGDPASRTFTVQLVLDNPHGRLKSGMFARVGFGGDVRRVLILPREALVSRGQLRGAYVVDDASTVRLRWLRLGELTDGGYEVLSGLEGGEQVVLSPPSGLAEGTPIERQEG